MRQQKRYDDVWQTLVEIQTEPGMEDLSLAGLPQLPGIKTLLFTGNVKFIGGDKRRQKRKWQNLPRML
jgi:hypothetical protein